MRRVKARRKLRWALLTVAAAILGYQLFLPPIIGLADQGDFGRVIGRFGYGPEDQAATIAFVARSYVPNPQFRHREWEQPTSEYLFAGAAILLNKLISRDGRLDITVMGMIHVITFLAAFARLLAVTSRSRASPFAWTVALIALTDVGYAAYWNSFYTESASIIFFLLLAAEGVAICSADKISPRQIALWSLWAILLIMAKAQNGPLGILLTLFCFRLGWWSAGGQARRVAILGSAAIAGASAINLATIPDRVKWADAYNQIFLAILPESRNPTADLKNLGLDSNLLKYSGTGAWSPGSGFHEMVASGLVGNKINHSRIARFYFLHPDRIWRHAGELIPVAFFLRPEWCGNFERSAGFAPGARSTAFNLWSSFHERYFKRVGRLILIWLLAAPVAAAFAWIRLASRRKEIELFGLLGVCCLVAFLVAALGDAWDNVKHLALFNLLLDAYLIFGAGFAWSAFFVFRERLAAGKRC